MRKQLLLLKFLLVAALLGVGVNGAWAKVTPYSESYSSASSTTGWSTNVSGRYDPQILNDGDNYYLSVDQNNVNKEHGRYNNGATITGTVISGKAGAGDDFTLTFKLKLGSATAGTPEFKIADAAGSGQIISLKSKSNNSTTWVINGVTGQEVTLPNTSSAAIASIPWYSVTVSRKGLVTYLTIKNASDEVVFARQTISGASSTGGLGNITYATGRYSANLAMDDIVVRALESGDVPVAWTVTTNYLDEEDNTVAPSSYDAVEDGESFTPTYSATIDDEDYRYTYKSGGDVIASITSNTVVNIVYSKAALAEHTVTVKATGDITKTLTTLTVKDAKTAGYYFPRYIIDGTDVYQISLSRYDQGYYASKANITSDTELTATYSTFANNAAFYVEGEELSGEGWSKGNGNQTRASSGMGGYGNVADFIVGANLPAGKYTITAAVNGGAGATYTFNVGGYSISTQGYFYQTTSDEFELNSTTNVTFTSTGTSSTKDLDYILIQRTGDATAISVTVGSASFATYVPAYDLDFSSTTIEAYKVKVSSKGVATLTQVDEVPAGTPVLLYANGGATENIPVITSADAVTDNDLVAGTTTTATDGVPTTDGDYTNMILNVVDNQIGFYFANDKTVATDRAYLHIASTLAPAAQQSRMKMVFAGETTGVKSLPTSQKGEESVYNLAGQRVKKPTKGLYVKGGKKVIVK